MRNIHLITALILILAGSISAQKTTPSALKANPIFKEGINALADHLPTIASEKFTTLLKSKKLPRQDNITLLLLLTESQIQANKPNSALKTLKNPLITKHPDTPFWKGQATANSGRYNDAIKILEQTTTKSKHHQRAQIKIANLAAALNKTDKALSTLKKSIKQTQNNNISPQTYLSLAKLYLTKNDHQNATKTITKINTTDPHTNTEKQIILAQINILKKNYPQAIQSLTELVKNPKHLDKNALSHATLHLADALHLNGNNVKAINTLITFTENNKNSPLLSSIFSKLTNWIPSDAALTAPTIKQLITWADRDQPEQTNNITKINQEHSDLKAFAHYYYARHLANQKDTTSKTKAIFEFSILRLRHPTHILAGTSLTDTATTQLALNRIKPAKNTLKLIQELNIPIAPIAKQQAAFLLGKINHNEKNHLAAAAAFQKVVDTASKELRTAAIVNAASSYLAAADTKGFKKLQKNINNPQTQTNLTLEYALWLTKENKIQARTILQNFTIKHPDHPRITEARLALALNSLLVPPTDPVIYQNTIPQISKTSLTPAQQADYAYLAYRNAISLNNFTGAANIAKNFAESYPLHPRNPEFSLLEGQALYHNGQHNEARRILLSLTKKHPKHPLKNYAQYYAAMSAKLEGTPQSETEAISLFSKIASNKSSLSKEALHQLAKLHINQNNPQQAIKILQPLYNTQPKNKKTLNTSITLASAYHTLGNTKPVNFKSALTIYNTLISQFKNTPLIHNQIKYTKALTLQHMGNNEHALKVYYSVINAQNPKSIEWKWYYKCGFTAIAMLEEMKNPNAAIAIAKKLANTKGNRSQEAQKRARALEMKYMIWEK